jgi:hypothetical protein
VVVVVVVVVVNDFLTKSEDLLGSRVLVVVLIERPLLHLHILSLEELNETKRIISKG